MSDQTGDVVETNPPPQEETATLQTVPEPPLHPKVEPEAEPTSAHTEPGPLSHASPLPPIGLLRGILSLGLLFAFVGLLFGLRILAKSTLPHILTPDAGINYQDLSDGLPAPHLLDWDLSRIEMLASVNELDGGLLILAQIVLLGGLGAAAAKLLNPTFQLFRITHPETNAPGRKGAGEGSASLSSTIEAPGVIKAGLLLLVVGLPFALFWLLLREPANNFVPAGAYVGYWPLVWAPRMILLGIALWIGFHRDGLAGDFADPALNRDRSMLPRLAVQGALWGLLAFLIGRYVVPSSLEPLLTRYQALGTFNTTLFSETTWRYLIGTACGWFSAGALFALIGRRHNFDTASFSLLLAPFLPLGLALLSTSAFTRQATASRYDLTESVLKSIPIPYQRYRINSGVPEGEAAAQQLARRLGLTFGTQPEQPERSLLVFDQNGPEGQAVNVRQNGCTTDGLSATPASVEKVRNYLSRYKYRSGLSWAATEHLFDVAALHFDTTAALDAFLDDQSYSPHAARTLQPTADLFFVIAATPQHISLLDKWADPSRFAHPDRTSVRLIGDLYRRFGVVDKALAWYRKADMPRSFIAKIRAEQPLFHQGRVSGVLRLNGQPLAGADVGVIPWLMNGLPHRLEGQVARDVDEIYAPRPLSERFGSFHPIPYAFRWISASTVTDSRGAFVLDGLTEGKYRLIVSLPPDVRLTPPVDTRLKTTNQPQPFAVHYGNPQVDLGVIDLYFSK